MPRPSHEPLAAYRARLLRRSATLEERRLWQQLRRGALGAHFRRQEPIGPYIVDFVCHAARLVVEVDGEWHAWRHQDAERMRYLQSRGYRVLRFTNRDVLVELERVVAIVTAHLEDLSEPDLRSRARPSPLPAAGAAGPFPPSGDGKKHRGGAAPIGGKERRSAAEPLRLGGRTEPRGHTENLTTITSRSWTG